MQVCAPLERAPNALCWQAAPAVRAVQLERVLTKDEILTLYLGLAPMAAMSRACARASLAYFGKEPKRLSLAEAALLVAIPQSPEQRRPDRSGASRAPCARPRARSRGARHQDTRR